MTDMTIKRHTVNALLLWLAVIASPIVQATEGGGDNIGKGSEGFFAGMLPDPGWYGVLYTNYYHASRVNDGQGKSAAPRFRLETEALAGRLFYMSESRVAGGRVGAFAIGSLASLHNDTAQTSADRTGFGDLTVGPVLGWDAGSFHSLVAMDVVLPTGGYGNGRPLNTGGNYASLRPIFAFTHLSLGGTEVSAKITYTFNRRNPDTDYLSGQLFHFDYSASYPMTSALRLGVNGYFLKQTSNDEQYGHAVNGDGNRARVMAIGPALHYQFGKTGVDFKVLKEFGAENHTEGTSVWLKTAFAL
jgi:hypothetical protein